MNLIKNVEDLIGKTINLIIFPNGGCIIRFDDDSVVQFSISYGYEAGDSEIEIDTDEPSPTVQRDLGFISTAELNDIIKASADKMIRSKRADDVAQLRHLANKYGMDLIERGR